MGSLVYKEQIPELLGNSQRIGHRPQHSDNTGRAPHSCSRAAGKTFLWQSADPLWLQRTLQLCLWLPVTCELQLMAWNPAEFWPKQVPDIQGRPAVGLGDGEAKFCKTGLSNSALHEQRENARRESRMIWVVHWGKTQMADCSRRSTGLRRPCLANLQQKPYC